MTISLAKVTLRFLIIPSFKLNGTPNFDLNMPKEKTKPLICKIHLIPLYLGKPKSTRAERA